MRIFISYFYKVRFLTPNQIPFSTAVWDPKWFHDFKGQSHIFYDKRGVVNGLRIEPLAPRCTDCSGRCEPRDPSTCGFMREYREQLDSISMEELLNYFKGLANCFNLSDPDIVLLVHEAPSNPCSERVPLMDWFKSHGIEVMEL